MTECTQVKGCDWNPLCFLLYRIRDEKRTWSWIHEKQPHVKIISWRRFDWSSFSVRLFLRNCAIQRKCKVLQTSKSSFVGLSPLKNMQEGSNFKCFNQSVALKWSSHEVTFHKSGLKSIFYREYRTAENIKDSNHTLLNVVHDLLPNFELYFLEKTLI